MFSRAICALPRHLALLLTGLAATWVVHAEDLSITVPAPTLAQTGYFKLGTTRNPNGHELGLNSQSLLLDGQPWFPVMGEMHYSRVPQAEWREELLKMKAGGIDIVATYVFWIHHEEVEGQWDWTGPRDLKKFLDTCQDVGLKVVIRCGPWCHGEVRNGGFPDWVVAHKDWKLRSTDPHFLAAVKPLYDQIAAQTQGELWKDGGPVIGIQVDNEFHGPAKYLLALKQMAIASGLDVPFYIRTGWPATTTPVPLGELIPLFGGYADGFWLNSTHAMPGDEWKKYTFTGLRTDTAIGADQLGKLKAQDATDTASYPDLCCEIGGGMEPSYHRRVWLSPTDIESLVLAKLGSGTSLLGYYMYHGGQNPEGQLTPLNESQASGYPNDMPVKSYDFNAPLGEYGQVNPQYHWLRRLHLFIHDFGYALAPLPAFLPGTANDTNLNAASLRWSVRSDGRSGFVFVNNCQRYQYRPAHPGVQFHLNLPGETLTVPDHPVTIPADRFFVWPFHLDLDGVDLAYATAQPVCQVMDGLVKTFIFAETPGVPAKFALALQPGQRPQIFNLASGKNAELRFNTPAGETIQLVVLNEADSLSLWKGRLAGADRVLLSPANVTFDHDTATLTSDHPENLQAEVYPAPTGAAGQPDGTFLHLSLPASGTSPAASPSVTTQLLQSAGPAREIVLSPKKPHQPLAPQDSDFQSAAVWKIQLPAHLDPARNPILRIRYAGDVARVTLNGRLLDDNFYCGREFDLGLNRYLPEIRTGDLRLEILPLRPDAPLFIEDRAKPDFGTNTSLVKLFSVQLVQSFCTRLKY